MLGKQKTLKLSPKRHSSNPTFKLRMIKVVETQLYLCLGHILNNGRDMKTSLMNVVVPNRAVLGQVMWKANVRRTWLT